MSDEKEQKAESNTAQKEKILEIKSGYGLTF